MDDYSTSFGDGRLEEQVEERQQDQEEEEAPEGEEEEAADGSQFPDTDEVGPQVSMPPPHSLIKSP